jgi:hypothetical protein
LRPQLCPRTQPVKPPETGHESAKLELKNKGLLLKTTPCNELRNKIVRERETHYREKVKREESRVEKQWR